MLLVGAAQRLSIDIDIIVPDKEKNLDGILDKICADKGFVRYEKQERPTTNKILKEHYSFIFTSALNHKESSVILDVLKEDIHYSNIVPTPLNSDFIEQTDTIVNVPIPDFNNILGDKLTAFAPNTTGIPYYRKDKDMGMEIIKQLYDIGCLFDTIDDLNVVAGVFKSFAATEIAYRNNSYTEIEVLDDVMNTALSICLRKNVGQSDFNILQRGITRIQSFIFAHTFHLEKAITCAAKAAYIATLIKNKQLEINRFSPVIDMSGWSIEAPMDTKLNKLKKNNPEAFYYLWQVAKY